MKNAVTALLAAVAFALAPGAAAQPKGKVESVSRPLQFEACLELIRRTAQVIGVAPINIVETTAVRMVRFNTSDGSVLITCSRPDQKVVITRSPHRG